MIINCFVCKREFPRKPSQVERAIYNYCSMSCRNTHYSVIRRGENNFKWKGGRTTSNGYIYILNPSHPNASIKGYVAEHRFVMEKKIGRYLTREEVVHHINHNKTDNRSENLELLDTQSPHASLHMKEFVKSRNRDDYGKFL